MKTIVTIGIGLALLGSASFGVESKQASRDWSLFERKDSPTLGNCRLLQPNITDRNDRFCPNTYGVAYKGYLISSTCYNTLSEAMNVMKATSSCTKSGRLDRCSLLFPNHTDKTDRFCAHSYGVTYQDYLADQTCFTNLDSAYAAMEATTSCGKEPKHGYCKIIFPNRTDNNDRFCSNKFGVTYEDVIIDGNCYSTIDEAFGAMESNDVCRD
jgi:hypothetical protein